MAGYLIGIDTGTHTGIAIWDGKGKRFLSIKTMPIHEALLFIHKYIGLTYVTVVFEDARKRRWYGTQTASRDRARLQGAGSIKRDCTIWEEALTDWGIPFEKVAPRNNMTKLSAEQFRRITGWTEQTNEHGRDAAMLVFGR